MSVRAKNERQAELVDKIWDVVGQVQDELRSSNPRGAALSADLSRLLSEISSTIELFALRPSAGDSPTVEFVRVDTLEKLLDSMESLWDSKAYSDSVAIAGIARDVSNLLSALLRAISSTDDRYTSLRVQAGAILSEIRLISERVDLNRMGILLEKADDAVAYAEQAAGKASDITLTKHYEEYSKNQEKIANQLRFLSSAILIAVAGAAVAVLYVSKGESALWPEEVARLTVSVPLLFLAFYLSRESSRHRSISARTREIDMRLQTVKGFTEGLPDDVRDEVRATLGRVIYGGSLTLETSQSDNAAGQEAVQTMTAALQAARGVVTRSPN